MTDCARMPPDHPALDDIDRDILSVLAEHGRLTWQQLGTRVRLSPNAAAARVRRLEDLGIIAGYRAVIDPVVLGRGLEAVVLVKMHPGCERAPFETFAAESEAVEDTVHLTGPHDYLMRVRCRGTEELDRLLTDIKESKGVADSETRVVLRRLV